MCNINILLQSVLLSFYTEKAVFRPSDEAVFTTLGVNTHLFACEPSELESLVRNGALSHLHVKIEIKQVLINYAADTVLIGVSEFVLAMFAFWFNYYCRAALRQ